MVHNQFSQLLIISLILNRYYKYKNMAKCWVVLAMLSLSIYQISALQQCQLTINKAQDQPSQVNKSIDLSLSPFSISIDNLYNKTFTIFKANPISACRSIVEPFIPIEDLNPTLVVIDMDQGFCGMRRRMQLAREIGCKGVILVSQSSDETQFEHGSNDNNLLILIGIGADKKTFLLNSKQSYMVGSLNVNSSNSEKKKNEIDLWISSLDSKSYQLLLMWNQTLSQIPSIIKKIDWRPRFALWGCNSGLFNPNDACKNNPSFIATCVCSGQFCSPQKQQKQQVDTAVKQDIRQKLIFNADEKKYLSYIKEFNQHCLSKFQQGVYIEDCANNINYTIIQDTVDSFIVQCRGDIYKDLMLDRNRFSQLSYYPAVILNRQQITYTNKKDLQNQLCRKLSLEKEEGCIKITKVNTTVHTVVSVVLYAVVTLVVGIIVAVLIWLYRKTIKKQMQKEMKMQVAASVQHYFALTEVK